MLQNNNVPQQQEMKNLDVDLNALASAIDKKIFNGSLCGMLDVRLTKVYKKIGGTANLKKNRNGQYMIALAEHMLEHAPNQALLELLIHEMAHAYLHKMGLDREGKHGRPFTKLLADINRKFGLNVTVGSNRCHSSPFYILIWELALFCTDMPYIGSILAKCLAMQQYRLL